MPLDEFINNLEKKVQLYKSKPKLMIIRCNLYMVQNRIGLNAVADSPLMISGDFNVLLHRNCMSLIMHLLVQRLYELTITMINIRDEHTSNSVQNQI